jgi:hypothetical protein
VTTTFLHGKDNKVMVAEYDLSGYFNDVDCTMEAATHIVTAHGDDSHVRHAGLGDGALRLSGILAQSAEDILAPKIAAAAGSPITYCIGGSAVDAPTRILSGLESKLATTAPVAGMIGVRADFLPDDGLLYGRVLHALGAETATDTESSIDNTDATEYGGFATLHVTAASGTDPTLDVKIQHAVSVGTWVDLVTFTQAAAATSELVDVAKTTTVNRHLRAIWTIGGTDPSFTFLVAFGRRYRD